MERQKLEIYLHFPFCAKKCAYCDFLSAPGSEELQREYYRALRREILAAAEIAGKECITTVFLGGGTPSLSPSGEVLETMDLLRRVFSFEEGAEVTVETNPGTLTREKLREYRESGINRLSIGCQSVREEQLRKLGRIHTFPQFLDSFRLAREEGFTNLNVDLMSGLPGQTLAEWEENLRTVAALEPEHISAYSLIVEEGTPFAEMELDLPGEDEEREMYRLTAGVLGEYGYEPYEISNYAKPGCACRHNLGYWRRVPYLGFGIGAASLYREERFRNTADLRTYLRDSAQPDRIRRDREKIDRKTQMEETMILGLRTRQGVSLREFRESFGEELESVYRKVLGNYLAGGFLAVEEGCLRLTERGIDVSNPILADFLLD